MSPWKRRLLRLLLLCGSGYLLVLGLLWVAGPGMIVTSPSPVYAPVQLPAGAGSALEIERAGARVRAWVVEPEGPARGTLLMLHGIRDSKRSLLPAAASHAERGLRVVVVDSRGHGESSGEHLTYGVQESQDLVALVDQLDARGQLVSPLIVLGMSYGAGTAIQFAARDSRVRTTIAISSFASLEEVARAYVGWIGGPFAVLVPPVLVSGVLEEAGRRADLDTRAACPRCVAPRAHGALRLVHSRDDERIPFAQAESIQRAAAQASLDLQVLWVDGASHNETSHAAGVQAAVGRWIDAAIAGEP